MGRPVVAMSIMLGAVVAGYGLAGSYLSIADLADRHHVPLALRPKFVR